MIFFHAIQYAFVQRAIITGTFIAIACSSLGMFLVLRKMSLIGDGLSHVSFGAISVGILLGIYPLWIALPFSILGAILILKISSSTNLFEDTAIGIMSSICIAGGVIITSLANGFNADLLSYLFGNILTVTNTELWFSIIISLTVVCTIYFFYWDLYSITFDEEYSKTINIKTVFINHILLILTAITVVLSIKIVGTLLVSALLIFPASTALHISKKFNTSILLCIIISSISVCSGIYISIMLDLPIGSTIVILNAIIFLAGILFCKKK